MLGLLSWVFAAEKKKKFAGHCDTKHMNYGTADEENQSKKKNKKKGLIYLTVKWIT